MKLPPLIDGVFLHRLNRFAAMVSVDGRETMVHVANSGRMRELLRAGSWCGLAPADRPGRKTAYDLALEGVSEQGAEGDPGAGDRGEDHGLVLVSADARLPPALVTEAILEGRLEAFAGYTGVRREVTYGDSRLDVVLDGAGGRCFIEVKSVTLVEGGVALFPDAPTERGRRHVQTLARAVEAGHRGAAVFVIQRGDAVAFTPHDQADPAFGAALRDAVSRGVEAHAYTCSVTRSEVRIIAPAPVRL